MHKYRTLGVATALYAAGIGHALAINDTGGEFDQTLARHYEALARIEQALGDRRDAQTYTQRAAAAAAGQRVEPDTIERRRPYLKEKYVPALDAARHRLVDALDGAARTRAATDAAQAQASFDCWIEQAQEDLQPDDIAACRNAFETAMAGVDARLAQVEPAPPPPPAPPPVAAPTSYLVFFDFDRAEITPEGHAVLENVVNDAGNQPVSQILAIGHADTAGSMRYNQRLSQRRADAVRAALSGLQIDAASIKTDARGETSPLVPTEDGVREPQNRRVEIRVGR